MSLVRRPGQRKPPGFIPSIFKDAKINHVQRYLERVAISTGRARTGSVMVVEFELNGSRFVGLNGRTTV